MDIDFFLDPFILSPNILNFKKNIKMKHALIFSFVLICFNSFGQSPASSVLGKFTGYSESYSMGKIGNRDIIVPGISHTFTILANNQVTLAQVSDNGDKANYRGKYSKVEENGKAILKCKMVEISKSKYPSTPEYYISFKADGSIECNENPTAKVRTPAFLLKRQ